MTRNPKIVGLAAVSALAMIAVFASVAQAQVKGTLGASPAWVTGEPTAHPNIVGNVHTFTLAGGQVLSCEEAQFTATATNGDTSVTVVPSYNGCSVRIGSEVLPMTVTMNDCDYLFYGGKEVSSTTFNQAQGDLVCPPDKVVEVHVYKDVAHTQELCTITIPPFVNNVGGESHNISGSPNDVTITSTTTGIVVKRDGSLLCGAANSTATYTGATTVKAFEYLGGAISNGTVSSLEEGEQISATASR